jgi:hypothetical protein
MHLPFVASARQRETQVCFPKPSPSGTGVGSHELMISRGSTDGSSGISSGAESRKMISIGSSNGASGGSISSISSISSLSGRAGRRVHVKRAVHLRDGNSAQLVGPEVDVVGGELGHVVSHAGGVEVLLLMVVCHPAGVRGTLARVLFALLRPTVVGGAELAAGAFARVPQWRAVRIALVRRQALPTRLAIAVTLRA